MNLENGRLSERQVFRIGLLENITIGMVCIPYITTRIAGDRHVYAFCVALVFLCIYGLVIYGFSKWFPEGLVRAVNDNMGWACRVVDLIYVFRYVLRASVILFFFSTVIHRYMLRSMNIWIIAVPFVFICGYGAMRDVEKRGRLLELLFWWMIVPLILVAVFAVSNIDWQSLPPELFGERLSGGSLPDIFLGAYLAFLVVSSVELMTFTLVTQKQNHWKNSLKILIWILIAMILAYVFIIGILGSDWVRADSTATLNVMEASALPGGLVERLDYPVLAFWVIGVFAVISGYLFYAKEFAGAMFDKKSDHRSAVTVCIPFLLVLLVLIGMWILGNAVRARYVMWYLIWIDVGISVLLPLVVALVRCVNKRKGIYTILLCMIAMIMTGCGNKYESSSLEDRDYVVSMIISDDSSPDARDVYVFAFEIADLTDYMGDSAKALKTSSYSCESGSLEDALHQYYDENDRQLDVGHINEMTFYPGMSIDAVYDIVKEFSMLPMMAKSVPVHLMEESGSRDIILRELIKEAYAGEDS